MTLAFRASRDHELAASLGYIVRPCLTEPKHKRCAVWFRDLEECVWWLALCYLDPFNLPYDCRHPGNTWHSHRLSSVTTLHWFCLACHPLS